VALAMRLKSLIPAASICGRQMLGRMSRKYVEKIKKKTLINNDRLLHILKPNKFYRSVIFKRDIYESKINHSAYLNVKGIAYIMAQAVNMLSHV
jgi:hypothetical protein